MTSKYLIAISVVALLTLHGWTAVRAFDPDYDEGQDYHGSAISDGGGSSDTASMGGDVYDPALLQQEVEAIERRNSVEHLDAEVKTEVPLIKDVNNLSTNNISREESNSNEHDLTAEEAEEEEDDEEVTNPEEHSSEEYEDDSHNHSLSVPPTKRDREAPTAPAQTIQTTSAMIPEYVRKAKSESFAPAMVGALASEEEADTNDSLADYVDDEGGHKAEHTTMQHQQQNETEDKVDSHEPLAMKFYQDDNKLKDTQKPLPAPMPRKVDTPPYRDYKPFKATSAEQPQDDEEDYEDTREDDGGAESQSSIYHKHKKAHSAPLPTYQPSVEIARAFIPWFNSADPATTAKTTTTATTATTTATTARSNTTPGLSGEVAESGVGATAPPPAAATGLAEPATVAPAPPHRTTNAAPTPTTRTPPTITTMGALAPTATTSTTTATTTTTTTTTTQRPASSKQGKNINIGGTGRRLLPHEQLCNYIEDAYIRMPLAVIVDPSAASLEKTKALWRDALRTNLNIKIVLVSLNGAGIPAAYNFNNTRQFLAGLNSIKEHNGGNAFIGVVHASELVPYDSAVFISTADIPPHTELVQDAAITLLKKRIRLYLIWYGERAVTENETQDAVGGILGEVAIRSGGEIMHIVGSENAQELESSTPTIIADAYRGPQEVDIPVDTTLSSLHVKIDAPMRLATLETPNGG